VRAELRELFAQLNAAPKARDRTALEQVYPGEFVVIHGVGGIADRARQIDRLLTIPEQASIPTPSFDDLHIYGDTAVLGVRDDALPAIATTVLAKRDRRWQIIQIQTTLLPHERKPAPVDRAVLQHYVGQYEQTDGVRGTITLEGDGLMLQLQGHSKLRLLPESDTQFFYGTDKLTFYQDGTGRVTHSWR
jgi:hypothetical protein